MRALRKQYYACNIFIIVTVLIGLTACAKRAPRAPSERYRADRVSAPGLPKLASPIIRVGLKTDAKSAVFTGSRYVFYNNGVRAEGVSDQITATLSAIPEVESRFSVQIASFTSRENAAKGLSDLRTKTRHRLFIQENPDIQRFQLRLGPYQTKEKAQQAIEEARRLGFANAFYVSEETAAGVVPQLVLLDRTGNRLLQTDRPVTLWTVDQTITIDGNRYRGYMRAFVNQKGRITIVNVVHFEDYLYGVVPGEIGPANQSTLEALKAQAVAARTYAYKNLRQFESEGYDLCATPRCQVYDGMSKEHPYTTRAVQETKGEILTHKGEPINALYTSTCGGRTEDVQYMFVDWQDPYLRSVSCYPEQKETTPIRTTLNGQARPWWLAWLHAKTGLNHFGDLRSVPSVAEMEQSFSQVLRYLGKTPCSNSVLPERSWVGIARYFVEQLCWKQKQQALLLEADYNYFLRHLDLPVNPNSQTQPFLFLFHEGILQPSDLSNFRPEEMITREEYYKALYNVLEHYHQINPAKGQVRETTSSEIQIVNTDGVHSYPISQTLSLYQKIGERVVPKDRIVCSAGDQVEYFLLNDRVEILSCELHMAGAAVDRSSKYSFWQESFDPVELGKKVSKYLDAGEIVDLQPLSYGVSNRVYELKVTGTKNSGVLRGIRVRWALGLPDNLFVIDRTYRRDGRIEKFIFTGRGWGHGVGMCQIGALGYAKQGKDYRQILTHYYTGVSFSKVY